MDVKDVHEHSALLPQNVHSVHCCLDSPFTIVRKSEKINKQGNQSKLGKAVFGQLIFKNEAVQSLRLYNPSCKCYKYQNAAIPVRSQEKNNITELHTGAPSVDT